MPLLPAASPTRATVLRLAGLALLLGCAAVAAAVGNLPQLLAHPVPAGVPPLVAAVVFVLLVALGSVAFVPKPLLALAAGAVFGFGEGMVLAVVGTTLGATVSFWLGRHCARAAVRPLLQARVWQALDRRLTRQGFWTVVALRLLPVLPFAAVNYGAALAGTRLRAFVAGTALGVVPASAATALAGATAGSPSPVALWASAAALVLLGALAAAPRLLARRPSTG
ncbi:TVP38/TMEM64 family protein [Streptacidiphilus sp. EB129]|uniref:TVP38/TMEM64 family protein n=1 Tax=Streptacidiphilus sp. EB129 TaxID=3156262 RepID=UPI003517CC21